MTKRFASAWLAMPLAALATSAWASEECGNVSIAEMNWASAGVAAQVDKIILEQGYGCSVELVAGDTMPTFTSMNEKGEPDMAPELWVNAVRTPLDAAVGEGRLVIAAEILEDGGVEGWWIPKYIAEAHPEIDSVQAALEHPELFPAPEDPSVGGVYNCPSGWNCQISTANLFAALGAEDKGFELIDTGSAAGLDGSIANAYEREAGWLGYYWAPTAILGKYEMVRLSFGVENDKAEWDACTAIPDCPEPKVNSYPVSDVFTVVTKEFADKAGFAMDYVAKRKWSNDTVGKILAWMDENQGTNEDAAYHFLETMPELWKTWVPEDVAQRVSDAL
ncbi:glycine betaine/proline transport system substrate-binding protein [Rhodobacter aestuarii]|uniref:Glycine betaine/proline transport system substrate-binding protein n=1 Tax=Rhodobacter aestuarii TaxID=453582 RepID=A0A1N7JBK9_9RHOB|nr:ABC transporter substrate-binding protein [Rhodobacter aestuarii]PTV96969.1 glycine betaine/proline transport system substrate-binding protein [Rhodobacter aestuarii]SIS46679.1 glycine betaine/proline transport system substrate-binding protein [Rhodobacter aestuarii]